MKCQN